MLFLHIYSPIVRLLLLLQLIKKFFHLVSLRIPFDEYFDHDDEYDEDGEDETDEYSGESNVEGFIVPKSKDLL